MKKKTIRDVMKILDPLYKRGAPLIVKESDYKWIAKVLAGKIVKDTVVYYKEQPVYIETLDTKVKPAKITCRGCGKSSGKIGFYIIADNLEEPKPYHKKCIDKLHMDVWMSISGIK